MKLRLFAGLLLAAMIGHAHAGDPDPTTYTLEWASSTTGATASGFIVLDRNLIINPGFNIWELPDPTVLDFGITVTGSASGDGTWTIDDYDEIILDTNGGTLDFDIELVGQPTDGNPWGPPSLGDGGDFNIFVGGGNVRDDRYDNPELPTEGGASPPNGVFFFEISVGGGESLLLTSFRPAGVPESQPVPTMTGLGLALLLGVMLFFGMRVMARRTS